MGVLSKPAPPLWDGPYDILWECLVFKDIKEHSLGVPIFKRSHAYIYIYIYIRISYKSWTLFIFYNATYLLSLSLSQTATLFASRNMWCGRTVYVLLFCTGGPCNHKLREPKLEPWSHLLLANKSQFQNQFASL